MNDAVEYRDIPGFPGYRVGSDGSVWTMRLRNGSPGPCFRTMRPRVVGEYGHLAVTLYGASGSKQTFIHKLILEAFVGPCPDGLVCCHEDGNPANNALSNLRWDTHKANAADSIRHGTMIRGSRAGRAILSESIVAAVKWLLRLGVPLSTVATGAGVADSTIRDIAKGRTWRHVS